MANEALRPLRIAFLTYRGKNHCGGQGVYTRHLTRELVEMGHTVEVFSGQPYPKLSPGVKLHKLESLDIFNSHHPGRTPGFWEIKSLPDLAELGSYLGGSFGEPLAFSMRAYQAISKRLSEFDLVHDNQSLGYGLLGLKQAGLPVIVTFHHPITVDRRLEIDHARNVLERFSKRRWYSFTRMQSRVARQIERIMTITQATRYDINASHGVPLSRINIVPVGVDLDLFKPVRGISKTAGQIITTASADVPLKGLIYLIEALAKLRTENPAVRLVVIGKPVEGGTAAQAIERLEMKEHIDFVSGISDQDLVKTYARSEVAVVPSLYEGFSLPAIEAMATGTPLVATNGGGLPEVVGQNEKTAILVEPGDSDLLKDAISRLLNEPEKAKKIGRAGRKWVSDNWSWKLTAQKTSEQYDLLLADIEARKNTPEN